jgi:hypothetical protein
MGVFMRKILVMGLMLAMCTLAQAQTPEEVRASAVSLADAQLNRVVHTVVEKTVAPPSGDLHDWVTQAPYWWADPKNPKGKYIRHDGKRNPEIDRWSDDKFFTEMLRSTEILSQGYALTHDERYAQKAVDNLRLWFINPATRMNPNLNYGQFIPGITSGRGEGIISTRFIYKVPLMLERLRASSHWTSQDANAMTAWFQAYLDWLTRSPIGQEEARHVNNHLTSYMVQDVSIQLYLGHEDLAKVALGQLRDQVIENQITPEGLQPHELERTKSFSYSSMNLNAWWVLAYLAKRLDFDFLQTPMGQRLFLATDALIPFDDLKRWPHPQIASGAEKDLCRAIDWVQRFSKDPKYQDAESRFHCPQTLESYFIQHEL